MDMPEIDPALMDLLWPWGAVAAAAVVIVLVVGFVWWRRRRKRRHELSERFGSEYDRAVDENGSKRAADIDLTTRLDEREEFSLRALSPDELKFLRLRWEDAQVAFVDGPAVALRRAEALVGDVMRERGYPDTSDRSERIRLLSVDHPRAAEAYRVVDDLVRAGELTTEDRREAMVHLHRAFAELTREPSRDRKPMATR